jgi:flagellar motor switch protein FliM
MPLDKDEPLLRRKVTPKPPAPEAPVDSGPAAGLVRAVSRILSVSTPLIAEDASLHRKIASLPELLDTIEPDAFVVTLPGGGGTGLAVIDLSGFSALVEAMTIGRLATRAPAPRRATATDSALLAGFLDSVLADLGADPAGLRRCGRPVPDHRLIGVLLEDGGFDLVAVTARLVCGAVSRPVRLMLALPRADAATPAAPADAPAAPSWATALEAAVMAAPASLRAELGRITLPLAEVLELGVGSALVLPLSALEDIQLVALDGTAHASGRLGQSRGNRAVRLTRLAGERPPTPPMQDAVPPSRSAEGGLPAPEGGGP